MSPNRVPRDLAAAAAVHAARQEIVQALGPLAASPLDEQATTQMRAALERAESPEVRDALRHLFKPSEAHTPLAAVPATAGELGEPGPQPSSKGARPGPATTSFASGGAA